MKIITTQGAEKNKKDKIGVGVYIEKKEGLIDHAYSTERNKNARKKKKIKCPFKETVQEVN